MEKRLACGCEKAHDLSNTSKKRTTEDTIANSNLPEQTFQNLSPVQRAKTSQQTKHLKCENSERRESMAGKKTRYDRNRLHIVLQTTVQSISTIIIIIISIMICHLSCIAYRRQHTSIDAAAKQQPAREREGKKRVIVSRLSCTNCILF